MYWIIPITGGVLAACGLGFIAFTYYLDWWEKRQR